MKDRRSEAAIFFLVSLWDLFFAIYFLFADVYLISVISFLFFAICFSLGMKYSLVVPGHDEVLVRRTFLTRKFKIFRWPVSIVLPWFHDYWLVDLRERRVKLDESSFGTKNGVFQVSLLAKMRVRDENEAIVALVKGHGANFNSAKIDQTFRVILENGLREVLDKIHGFVPEKIDAINLRTLYEISNVCAFGSPMKYALQAELNFEKLVKE